MGLLVLETPGGSVLQRVVPEEYNAAWKCNVYHFLSKTFSSANPSATSVIVLVFRKISVPEMNSVTPPLGYGFALLVTSTLSGQVSEQPPINVACLFTADPSHPEYQRARHCAPSQKGHRRPVKPLQVSVNGSLVDEFRLCARST